MGSGERRCEHCGETYIPGGWGLDGKAHDPWDCRDALAKQLADERKSHAIELEHVDMSGREADAARIADLERRLADSDDAHGDTIAERDRMEEWAEELHAALGCEHEASNLHNYFACIRHNALALLSHYESVEGAPTPPAPAEPEAWPTCNVPHEEGYGVCGMPLRCPENHGDEPPRWTIRTAARKP